MPPFPKPVIIRKCQNLAVKTFLGGKMARIGYARVSTADQSLDLQIDALEKAGCERIFSEKASGVGADRPELDRMMDYVREGDAVVVWKLDRIGRSVKQLVELLDCLGKRGVDFISTSDGIDTTTPAGKMMFTVMAAFAEFEHDLIVERTNAGLAAARARGRKGGRPAASQEAVDLAIRMYESGDYTIGEIVSASGISKNTLYRHLRFRKAFNDYHDGK